jgi:hypothetical protein
MLIRNISIDFSLLSSPVSSLSPSLSLFCPPFSPSLLPTNKIKINKNEKLENKAKRKK